MPYPGKNASVLSRLDVRLVALLGLALLPIGLIAMVQTYRVINSANISVEAALLGKTLAAASSERETILKAIGAAKVAARLTVPVLENPDVCSARLSAFVNQGTGAVFAGYINEAGTVVCGSEAVGVNLSDSPVFQRYIQNPVAKVDATTEGRVSGQSVIIIIEPVVIGGTPAGYIALSVPHSAILFTERRIDGPRPLDTITYNASGDILTSKIGRDTAATRLPVDVGLQSLTTGAAQVFRGETPGGRERLYTYAPLYPGSIYALSIWLPATAEASDVSARVAVLFPALMWLASLSVAYFAVHRLVVRHIADLRQNIRAFAATRRIMAPQHDSDIPLELREVTEAFQLMTERIVRDEAEQEDSLHEKGVLLKEVHHRVKNNLQLIASITNMQVRKSRNPETKFMLRRLQDRVLGLATIHRTLYQASVLSRVRADTLITELADQMAISTLTPGSDIRRDVDIDPVNLYPDQAVPLSLLVTEALTNAMKYLGRPAGGEPWVRISLKSADDGRVTLRVVNSMGEPLNTPDLGLATGLGTQLINAFVMQLGATASSGEVDGVYVVEVSFTPSNFTPEDVAA